ncbi:cilia- and flagella-associated protein 276 [Poeciliopsis prolifica]|uniref:cilia- and flagella-associated protein 276 n=1 Tax=Poeciliopsis prolifica TaxID=188132 RepID=UPI002413C532|nr:cilia- and flagella-associated protein 276 [Poeciliopsis prolifica]
MSRRNPNPSSPPLGDELGRRQVPKDSLDFKLNTVYDHHTALFWSKNEMLLQRETVNVGKLKREKLEKQLKLQQEQENGIRVWVDPRRNTYHYVT